MELAVASPRPGDTRNLLLWTEIDLDVVDALARALGRKELATFRLVCAAWKSSIDCCIKQLRSVNANLNCS